MNKLKLEIFNNGECIEVFENIPFEQKHEFIYFNINDTKYFFYQNLLTFSYLTQEEKVKMNFRDKIVTITLLQSNYTLEIKINKFKHEFTENTYKITYILDSERDVEKTFLITLS